MPKYKEIMFVKGIMQKEVLDGVRRSDPRVDKPLLSKIVNGICLPNKPTLDGICKALSCDVLDIYDRRELDLIPSDTPVATPSEGVNPHTQRTRRRRADNPFYNLTVEIPRDVAERVFDKESLRKLGYLSVTDFVRHAVDKLAARLDKIEANEKAAAGDTHDGE